MRKLTDEYKTKWWVMVETCLPNSGCSRRRAAREFVDAYLAERPCQRCGYNGIAKHFHHRESDDKEYGISRMIQKGYSTKSIAIEVEKCDVLCPTCHYEVEHEIRQGDRKSYCRAGDHPPCPEVPEAPCQPRMAATAPDLGPGPLGRGPGFVAGTKLPVRYDVSRHVPDDCILWFGLWTDGQPAHWRVLCFGQSNSGDGVDRLDG